MSIGGGAILHITASYYVGHACRAMTTLFSVAKAFGVTADEVQALLGLRLLRGGNRGNAV